MLVGMTDGYTKITVSLPSKDVEQAKAMVAGGGAKSVSALVADALHAKLSREQDLALLHDMTGGEPIPDEALAWAANVLGVPEVIPALLGEEPAQRGRIAS
jgi:hypothetical protein